MMQSPETPNGQEGFEAVRVQPIQPSPTGRSGENLGVPQQLKNPARLTKLLKILLYSSIAVAMLAIWSGYLEYDFLIKARDGFYSSKEAAMADAEISDTRQGIIGIIGFVVRIAALICYLVWVHRASFNARALGAKGLKFSPGWSVGWYFIPVANLWKPYQAMKEIFKASKSPANWFNQTRTAEPILTWWWVFWILSGVLAKASLRLSLRAEEIDELITANIISLISDVADIPSTVLTLVLVGTVFRMQMSAAGRHAQTAAESGAEVLTLRDD
ncbi:MAG: DUF4328 domain-containing protein [Planctomycetota bacterium]|jgi:hypothetical protein